MESQTRGTQQVSAGGVVVRRTDRLEVCLIRPVAKPGAPARPVWGLPKGGIEAGETHEDAALREIREETGVEGVIEADLGTIDYWFYSERDVVRVHKFVHFFLVRCTGGDTALHDREVDEAAWFDVEAALDRMTYPNERQTVRQAVEVLGARSQAPEP